jgi:hypothetical protein
MSILISLKSNSRTLCVASPVPCSPAQALVRHYDTVGEHSSSYYARDDEYIEDKTAVEDELAGDPVLITLAGDIGNIVH